MLLPHLLAAFVFLMPVTADTKVLNETLATSYQQLRAGFDRIT